MAGSIVPMVHGQKGENRTSLPLLLHLAGALLGGTALGILLGLLGALLPLSWLYWDRTYVVLMASGVLSCAFSMSEVGFFRIPYPNSKWQVPSSWRFRLPFRMTSFVYGLGLGFGVLTRSTVSTFCVTCLAIFLLGNHTFGGLCAAIFGLGRTLPLFMMRRAARDMEANLRISNLLHHWGPVVHLVNGVSLGVAGPYFLVVAWCHP